MPDLAVKRFGLYLNDISNRTLTNSTQEFGQQHRRSIETILSGWKWEMWEVFHPSVPLKKDPHQNIRLWRLIEWNLLEAARLGCDPRLLLERLKKELEHDLKGNQCASPRWIDEGLNLKLPIRELYFDNQDFIQSFETAFNKLSCSRHNSEEAESWALDIEDLKKILEHGAVEMRRATFILRKMNEQLDKIGQLKMARQPVEKADEVVDSNGKIREPWTKAGIIRLLNRPDDPFFKGFSHETRSNTSYSLDKRINSRHAVRMGVPSSEQEAKDGGRYFA
ncbi:uncharacterized protein JCM6883_000289 [Sporobolomyces salmoneus]|uniref:uncharacterized protein n=1 Tax=Sporobolomyces salmoneus TaxID=183962 RepID=UPI003176337E